MTTLYDIQKFKIHRPNSIDIVTIDRSVPNGDFEYKTMGGNKHTENGIERYYISETSRIIAAEKSPFTNIIIPKDDILPVDTVGGTLYAETKSGLSIDKNIIREYELQSGDNIDMDCNVYQVDRTEFT